MSDQWRHDTIVVHRGVYKDKTFNSVITPIYPSSNFYFDRLGVTRGYDYSRTANPTRRALEENLAALEGGADAWATSTGMAALTTVLMLFKAGDHIVAGHDIYGGTWRLLDSVAPRLGMSVSFVNMADSAAVRAAITPATAMMLIETPSNPLLNLVDIAEMTAIARDAGAVSVVDNTFMTPLGQRPFQLGADLIVHSTTKYLNGHSDVVGGAVISRDGATAARVAELGNTLGTGCSPFDAWLVLRGVKTLPQRMAAHERNAIAVAQFLEGHAGVRRVYFPGLASHPRHELALSQMNGFGGMVSFELDTGQVAMEDFFGRMRLFLLAESLGGIESLAEHPWSMSHASMSEAARRAGGITHETVRLSLGIEHPEDLIADLRLGLEGGE